MSSNAMCSSKLQQIRDLLGANTGRQLLLCLFTSLAHVTVSVILMFFWMGERCWRANPTGPVIQFGILSVAYTGISVILFATSVAHYYFAARSQRTLAITILGTSGASAVLACIGVVVFEMLMTGILGFCGSSIASYGISICSLIFLCLSIAVNALLFVASLLNWRQQMQIEQTLKEPTKSPYPIHLYPSHQLGMN